MHVDLLEHEASWNKFSAAAGGMPITETQPPLRVISTALRQRLGGAGAALDHDLRSHPTGRAPDRRDRVVLRE